jgi:hypothetical protein
MSYYSLQIKVKLSCYCHEGAKREKQYSFYSFLISLLDAVEWSASCPSRILPQEGPPVPIGEEAGWASKLVLDTEARGKIICLCQVYYSIYLWFLRFSHIMC